MGPPQPTPWQRATTSPNNPLPWLGPQQGPPAPPPPPVLPSVSASWGATTPNDPNTAAEREMPAAGVIYRPPETPGAPSMGFPAQTNPFGQPPPNQQLSQLPGSMFASAQNLMKFLFPTATG